MSAPAAEKRVSWAELFFDLVFVVAVTRVSGLLERDHSWGGLLRALIVFVPIYWIWVGTAIQTNLRDTSRPLLRLKIFGIALTSVFMALSLADAYGRLGMIFAVAYWIGRILLGIEMLWGSIPVRINPYTVSMCVTGPLLVLGALVHGDGREVIWGIAALVDVSTPSVLQRRLRTMHLDPGHLVERFGSFVLIALGESVVALTSLDPVSLDVGKGFAIGLAFAMTCGLWWVYFHFAADAMRHAMATANVQLDITRRVLSYGHLAFIAAIIVIAVGLHGSIAQPTTRLTWALTGLLFGGTAVYLASFGFTRWAMFRLVSWTRLTAAGAVLVLLPLAPHVPALVALAALVIVLAVLNTVELLRVEHGGWKTLLRQSKAA